MVRKSSYGGFDFTTGLVASWQFENNFNDYTGSHNATATGSVTNNTAGLVGNQADFGGTTDYLTVFDNNDFSFTDGVTDLPFTICTWVKFDSLTADGEWFINKRDADTNNEYNIVYIGGNFYFVLFGGGVSTQQIRIIYSFTPLINTWYHVVFTGNGDGTKEGLNTYINSVNGGVASEVGTYTGMINGTNDLVLGTQAWNFGNGDLDGKLDEVKVYKNRELTQLEITEMYTQELTGNSVLPISYPLANIISEYKFENNVLDTVGTNNGVATAITYVTGGVGKSADFNGSTSFVSIADSNDLSFTNGFNDLPFSISLLIKFDVFPSNALFLNKFIGTTGREYEIRWNNTQGFIFKLYRDTNSSNINAAFLPTKVTGQWYHITCTSDGSETKEGLIIYINGIEVPSTKTLQGTYTGMINNTGVLSLGKFYSGLHLNGKMDVVRLWDKELTSAEALAIATAELAGTDINP